MDHAFIKRPVLILDAVKTCSNFLGTMLSSFSQNIVDTFVQYTKDVGGTQRIVQTCETPN